MRSNSGGLDDRPPLVDFLALEFSKRFRALFFRRENILGQRAELFLNFRVRKCVTQSSIELGNTLLERPLRTPEGMPEGKVDPRHPRLIRGRNVGCDR